MNPPIFNILTSDMNVIALLGNRIYPWGRAPKGAQLPYLVYSVYNANPENYLDRTPDIDNKGTQVTIYAKTSQSIDNCYNAVRDALESSAHMTSFSTNELDDDTDLFSVNMEFDFWDER